MAAVERGMRAAGKRGVSPLHGHHPFHHPDNPGHPSHHPFHHLDHPGHGVRTEYLRNEYL